MEMLIYCCCGAWRGAAAVTMNEELLLIEEIGEWIELGRGSNSGLLCISSVKKKLQQLGSLFVGVDEC